MSHVYGDSTPFPYDLDYIDLLRGAVDCGVHLLSAQHAIDTASQRNEEVRERHRNEQDHLSNVELRVRSALAESATHEAQAVVSLASRILRESSQSVEEEVRNLKSETLNTLTLNDKIMTHAREAACRAVETLLLEHDIPESSLCLTLTGHDHRYRAQIVMNTPFGVSAVCKLKLPENHNWNQSVRVTSLCPGISLYLPRRKGWFRQGTSLRATNLDRLFVTEVTLDETHSLLTLRKAPDGGPGFRIGIAYEQDPRAVVSRIAQDGTLNANDAITLGGKDNAAALRLMRKVGESTRDLVRFRSATSSIVFDNQPLVGVAEPGAVARRLIAAMSPIARETARRSGAPGELVVRRNLGGGRREELYVTKDELFEKTQILPPAFQAEFSPLGIVSHLPLPPPQPAALN